MGPGHAHAVVHGPWPVSGAAFHGRYCAETQSNWPCQSASGASIGSRRRRCTARGQSGAQHVVGCMPRCTEAVPVQYIQSMGMFSRWWKCITLE